jgi:hypothetical protein
VNTQNTEVHEKSMADVPEHEISALRVLSEYEQMLGMDRIIKQYGITEAELHARLQPTPGPFTKIKDSVVSGDLHTGAIVHNHYHTTPQVQPVQPVVAPQQPVYHDTNAAPFIPDLKEAPALPSSATLLDKSNFRFEYDPSQEAATRRSAVAQAILCPGCGVALGIPDIRPIKVTCPQCLQETLFNV